MGDADKRLLVTRRVVDGMPSVPSRIEWCDICSRSVWVSKTSPQVDLYRCKQCGLDTIDPDQPFEPMTAEQLAEVEAVVGKLRQ